MSKVSHKGLEKSQAFNPVGLKRAGLIIKTIEYAVHEKTINYVRKESVLRKTVRKQMQLIKRHKMRPDTFLSRTLWQNRLSRAIVR